MNVVYYIAPRPKSDGFALKMSLRALDRYGKNLGRVIVTGSPADYHFTDLEFFRTPPVFAKSGVNENILSAIQKLIQEGLVQSEFLLMTDEIFLVRDVDLDSFPFVVRCPKIKTVNDLVRFSGGAVISKNRIKMTDTRNVLEKFGYSAIDCSCRTLMHVDPQDFPAVERMWLSEPHGEWGYDVASLFLNVRGRRENMMLTESTDLYLTEFANVQDVIRKVGDRALFAAGHNLLDGNARFRDMLERLFPLKSRFET